jgi:hypothetical protein
MELVGLIAATALMASAFMYILGGETAGKKFLTVGLLLAFGAPIVVCLVMVLGQELFGLIMNNLHWGVLGFLPLIIFGWVRFVNRKRALHRWWGETPTSAKKRIERD